MAAPITIPYSLLVNPDDTLPDLVQQAFSSSPSALGLLLVTMPPEFAELRKRVLLLANAFASLPDETRERYADASTKWSFGWSLGKEIMNGKPDSLKGSYYNNTTEGGSNIWPDAGVCDGFEDAYKAICAFMTDAGKLVARACDVFVQREGGLDRAITKTVQELIGESNNCKARLLHYFPPEGQRLSVAPNPEEASSVSTDPDDSWCGTHLDHGLLTALCPALFLFHPSQPEGDAPLEPLIIPSPSEETGLYIKTRSGVTIKGKIPENCLAFQTGETLSLLTTSRLAATPHFVSSTVTRLSPAVQAVIAAKQAEDPRWARVTEGKVSRETLAVFMQPNGNEPVSPSGETFGEFSLRVRKRHY